MHNAYETMSTTQLILSVLGWLALQAVWLFILWSSFGRCDWKHPFTIGEGGRRTISFGLPFIAFAMLLLKGLALDRFLTAKFGPNVFPYVFFGTMLAIFAGAMILDNYIPKRLSIALGIIGYAIGFSILYWHFVFNDPLSHS